MSGICFSTLPGMRLITGWHSFVAKAAAAMRTAAAIPLGILALGFIGVLYPIFCRPVRGWTLGALARAFGEFAPRADSGLRGAGQADADGGEPAPRESRENRP